MEDQVFQALEELNVAGFTEETCRAWAEENAMMAKRLQRLASKADKRHEYEVADALRGLTPKCCPDVREDGVEWMRHNAQRFFQMVKELRE